MVTRLVVLVFAACGGREPAPTAAPAEVDAAPAAATASAASEQWSGTDAPKSNEIAVGITDVTGGTIAVELVCNGGHRDRQAVVSDAAEIGGTVWFRGVGTDACILWFKGGQPAQFGPVSGGSAWLCTLVSTTAVCEPK